VSAARVVRRRVLAGMLLALGCLPLPAAPRESFFEQDLPIYYGAGDVEARLAPLRERRPIWALTLSGGSARAFAHLGVLKRLEQEGMRPDLIVTNSMGSIIGLLYAAGVPVATIEDILATVDFSSLFEPVLPTRGAFMDVSRLVGLVHALVGELDISALPLPILVVCEDLKSNRRVILGKGDFTTVLEAAVALPGLFEPVELDRFLLLDGGIPNLVPLEPFAGLADAMVVSAAFYDRDLKPSDPITILNMSLNIAKSRNAVEEIKRFSPFLIRNDVEQFTYMGWHQLAEIQARGFQTCQERIGALRAFLEQRGITRSSPPPAVMDGWGDVYRARWEAIKRDLRAGRPLPLPRPFWGVEVRSLIGRAYRGSNELEQSNYLAAGLFLEQGYASLRAGGMSDLQGRWGAFIGLDAAPGGRLLLSSFNSYLFLPGNPWPGSLAASYSYHRLRGSLPLSLGDQAVLSPYLQAEYLHDYLLAGNELFIQSGLQLSLPSDRRGGYLSGRLAYFYRFPALHGLEGELLGRGSIAGRLGGFGRLLLEQAWSTAGPATVAATYNDFYRGVLPPPGAAPASSLALFNADLVLTLDPFLLTLWEALIWKNLELSLFTDLLWPGALQAAAPPPPALGLSLQSELALMGLPGLVTLLAGGYDFGARAPFFSVNLGAVY
jgi:predicted acylesterase/phospholipase RssA